MPGPLIGITSSSGQGTFDRIEKVGRGYVEAVEAAGGIPVVLPTIDAGLAPGAIARIDGLLLTGGGDVDPARYDAEPVPECGPPDAARDAWELALLAAAREAVLPVLAICRGVQVLNVACGGTLVQHLPDRTDTEHDDLDGARAEPHVIEVVPGSLLAEVAGPGPIRANTLHHQAVGEVGDGLVASGRAEDGVIEAIEAEAPGAWPVLGVQWHPELLADRAPHHLLFRWLVDRARRQP